MVGAVFAFFHTVNLFRSIKKSLRPPALSSRELLRIQTRIEKETGIRLVHDIRVSKDVYIYHGIWPATASDDVERDVFVKVLLSQNPMKLERFERESWLYSHFRHDHLVRKEFSRALNLGRTFGRVKMIVLEYLDGFDLSQLLDYLGATGNKLDLSIALEIGIKGLKALSDVHQMKSRDGQPLKIIHSDVSPHNIFLSRKSQVKIIDFGVSRTAYDDKTLPRAGKPGYAAPEQIFSDDYDHRIDLFAMGVVLIEMVLSKRLAGVLVKERIRIQDLIANYQEQIAQAEIHQTLKKILIKSIHESSELRFQSAKEFMGALEDFVSEQNFSFRSNAIAECVEEVLQYYNSQLTAQTTGLLAREEEKPPSQEAKPQTEVVPNLQRQKKNFVLAPVFIGVLLTMGFVVIWKNLRGYQSELLVVENQAQVEKLLVIDKKTAETQSNVDEKPISENIQMTNEVWIGNLQIESNGAKIVVTDGNQNWTAANVLTIPDYSTTDEKREFSAILSRPGHKPKNLTVVLSRDAPNYSKSVSLEQLQYGSLFVGASPWAEISVPGFASQRPIPFSIKLPEGSHKITARYQNGDGKWLYLSKSVQIISGSNLKCLAYFESSSTFQCR